MQGPLAVRAVVPMSVFFFFFGRLSLFKIKIAYAYIRGGWVQCISEHYATLNGHSEREMMLATAELRQRHREHGRSFNLTARKLADFVNSLEGEERLLEQRLRDGALKAIRDGVGPQEAVEGSPAPSEGQDTATDSAALSVVGDANGYSLENLTMYGDF